MTTQHLQELQAKGLIRGYTETSISVGNPSEPKQAKYRNKKVEVDGRIFDSKKEAGRYLELRMLLIAGEISELECQVTYLLIEANGKEKKCEYKADFRFKDSAGKIVVEDIKSPSTRKIPSYIIKRKLLKEKYGIEIKEV